MWLRALVVSILLVPFSGAEAQDNNVQDCGAKSTQTEMTACFAEAASAANMELNSVYMQLFARLGENSKRLLQDAQGAWLTYRENECTFEGSGTIGGSIHPMIVAICVTQKSNSRIQELRAQLTCPEGDLACGR